MSKSKRFIASITIRPRVRIKMARAKITTKLGPEQLKYLDLHN